MNTTRAIAVFFLLLAVSSFLAGPAIAYFFPREYFSRTLVEVLPTQPEDWTAQVENDLQFDRSQVRIDEVRQTSLISVGAYDRSPEGAAGRASASLEAVRQIVGPEFRFKVWEEAVPSSAPAKPNIPLLLTIFWSVALLCGLFGALFLIDSFRNPSGTGQASTSAS